ncbi:hypothetical protein QQF64_018157 [Cirrhinus molitorella]|uniref:Uncharacterized protein n=1 Tax=Cirrhinus molitorella TaxID=172907 RepID=A0ABR3LNZ2_9TELE
MARRSTDETLRDEAGSSRGCIEKLRFMVLGGDDDLMDKACGTILGKRLQRNTFKFGELKPKEAQVCGRQKEEQKKEDFKKLNEELIFYKKRENELSNELDAFKNSKKQTDEDFQKLNEELIIYKKRENELSNELDALKNSKTQTEEDFQKLKKELIIYKDRNRQLKDDKMKLQREVERLKDEKQLQSNLTEEKKTG